MERWPDIFDDIISNIKASVVPESFNDSMNNALVGCVKVEDPQPYLNQSPTIPIPEVKS